jgi:hypothetical protein
MAPAADAWSDFVSGLRSAQVIDVPFEPVGPREPDAQKAAALPDRADNAEINVP